MGLKERLDTELKDAMRQKNTLKLSVIRLLKAAVKNEEIAKGQTLDDEGILPIVQREIKRRKEAIEGFQKGNRDDLVNKEEAEMAILYEYLPSQADEAEIRKVIQEIVGAIPEGAKINMGMIMPKALEKLKGRADGKVISRIVKEEAKF